MLLGLLFYIFLWSITSTFQVNVSYCDASVSNQPMSAYQLENIQNMLSQEGLTKALKGSS